MKILPTINFFSVLEECFRDETAARKQSFGQDKETKIKQLLLTILF